MSEIKTALVGLYILWNREPDWNIVGVMEPEGATGCKPPTSLTVSASCWLVPSAAENHSTVAHRLEKGHLQPDFFVNKTINSPAARRIMRPVALKLYLPLPPVTTGVTRSTRTETATLRAQQCLCGADLSNKVCEYMCSN